MGQPIESKQYLIIVISTDSGEFVDDWRNLGGFTAGGLGWDLLVVDGGSWRGRLARGDKAQDVVASMLPTHTMEAYGSVVCIHHDGLFNNVIEQLLADDRWIVGLYSWIIVGAPKARVLHTLRTQVGISEAMFSEIRHTFGLNSDEQLRLDRALQEICPPLDLAAISHDVLAPFHTVSSGLQRVKAGQDIDGIPPSEDVERAFSKARVRLYVRRGLLENVRAARTLEGFVLEHRSAKAQPCWERVSKLLPESSGDPAAHHLYCDCRRWLSALDVLRREKKEWPEVGALIEAQDSFHPWRASLEAALDSLVEVYASNRTHGAE